METGADIRFRLSSESVGSKVLEGEAVILHAESGRYHSVTGAGADAWLLLSSGCSIGETVSTVAEAYGADPEKVRADVTSLAEDLVREDLLTADPEADPSPPEIVAAPEGYEPMELITFSDIEDLLALDPPTPLMADGAWEAESRD